MTTSDSLILIATQSLVSLPCVLAWTILGTQLRRLLKSDKARQNFSYVMAIILVMTVISILFS